MAPLQEVLHLHPRLSASCDASAAFDVVPDVWAATWHKPFREQSTPLLVQVWRRLWWWRHCGSPRGFSYGFGSIASCHSIRAARSLLRSKAHLWSRISPALQVESAAPLDVAAAAAAAARRSSARRLRSIMAAFEREIDLWRCSRCRSRWMRSASAFGEPSSMRTCGRVSRIFVRLCDFATGFSLSRKVRSSDSLISGSNIFHRDTTIPMNLDRRYPCRYRAKGSSAAPSASLL